jgi:hypothetical protein
MLEENKSKESTCLFFASDYHFEMITLPYITKKIKEKNNIVVIPENNLEETVNTLLSRLNLQEKDKKGILEINWKNDDCNKIEELKEITKKNIPTTIFIKGKESYIRNINDKIGDCINKENINVIDCYDLNSIKKEIVNITENYKNVLVTSGIKKIQ